VRVGAVLRNLVRHPARLLVRRWNWKSAALSAVSRGLLFFGVNLVAGLRAAVAALMTEVVFRAATAGFYGAITQAFRHAEPRWAASLSAMVLLPTLTHSLELGVHWARGTVLLGPSILASVAFTAITTVFSLFAMRHGAFIVGTGRQSLGQDLQRVPWLLLSFITAPVRGLARGCRRRFPASPRSPKAMTR
jgi:hypothetical protein